MGFGHLGSYRVSAGLKCNGGVMEDGISSR